MRIGEKYTKETEDKARKVGKMAIVIMIIITIGAIPREIAPLGIKMPVENEKYIYMWMGIIVIGSMITAILSVMVDKYNYKLKEMEGDGRDTNEWEAEKVKIRKVTIYIENAEVITKIVLPIMLGAVAIIIILVNS